MGLPPSASAKPAGRAGPAPGAPTGPPAPYPALGGRWFSPRADCVCFAVSGRKLDICAMRASRPWLEYASWAGND